MKYFSLLISLAFIMSCKSNPSVTDSSNPKNKQNNKSILSSETKKYSGFFNFHYNEGSGKVYLEINKLDEEFLYVSSLVTGVGSNDIGLDRGQFGNGKVVKFIKNGPQIMLIQTNYNFRALSDNQYEKMAVKQAFAESILWGFEIIESNLDHYLVDATGFYLVDRHQVGETLKDSGQGNYKVDLSKSGIIKNGLKNFPQNSVVEALITLTGEPEGEFIRQVAPDANFVTVTQRHSFIQLPDKDYTMRAFDPRSGYFGISFYDYATPIDQPLEKQFITRHRLTKKDPSLEVSEPAAPIIYYLDPGVPEPVRSALLEGANWWNEAFEAAGFSNAFRVEMLPENADPMDIRYNLIQWVHRSTRGWSYGHSVIDPRTGEIIKGHVSLGSLRVRQDFLIAQGLLSPYHDDEADIEKIKEMALARIRQLAAHEVGHTLGLAHNYASSVNQRASVMDYPHPLIKLNEEGEIDLSEAYDSGIGRWDKVAIQYGYTEIPKENEALELKSIIENALKEELLYISDRDARSTGGMHPYAHLWDNGQNAADELNRIIEVRKIALNKIGMNSIPTGSPMATLEDVLVPVYLLHRYQLEATSKLIGGLNYNYALKGDGQIITAFVPPLIQKMALDAALETLQPEFLALPESLLELIPPKPDGFGSTRENFTKKTGLTFDPLSAAESSADYTLFFLLHPERASRVVEYHARNNSMPDLNDILSELINRTIKKKYNNSYFAEINRAVSKLVLDRIIQLSYNDQASAQARAIALLKVFDLAKWFDEVIKNERDVSQKAHYLYSNETINRYLENPEDFKVISISELPMGSPIGMDVFHCNE